MNRLAAMQDWPLFWQRAVTATEAALARSADGMTTYGSLPPSSSTVFLSTRPAISATDRPAGSLPVSVAARTRSSVRIASTLSEPTSRVWNAPSGKPARRNRSSRNSAVCGTFDACLSRPALPAIRAGAANRMTCQSGKFHGMTASTGPIGWYRTYALVALTAAASAGWSARSCSACSAKNRHPVAHLSTSALAAASVLPISVVIVAAMPSRSAPSRSAAARIHCARCANDVPCSAANPPIARLSRSSTCASDIASKVLTTSPVAGLIVAIAIGKRYRVAGWQAFLSCAGGGTDEGVLGLLLDAAGLHRACRGRGQVGGVHTEDIKPDGIRWGRRPATPERNRGSRPARTPPPATRRTARKAPRAPLPSQS